jgi:hypothetical protein
MAVTEFLLNPFRLMAGAHHQVTNSLRPKLKDEQLQKENVANWR